MPRSALTLSCLLLAGCATASAVPGALSADAAQGAAAPAGQREPARATPGQGGTAALVERDLLVRQRVAGVGSCPGDLPVVEGACWHESPDGRWYLGACLAGKPAGTLFVDEARAPVSVPAGE